MKRKESGNFRRAAFLAFLMLSSICHLCHAGSKLVDSDGNGVPDGYKIKSLKSTASIQRNESDGQDCIKVSSSGENGFTRVYFPIPETLNNSKENLYYLFVFKAKLSEGAEVKGSVKTTEGVSAGSQQMKFMAWRDRDISEWMNVRTPIELKPGDNIKKIYANISFTSSDAKAWIGAQYLEKINAKRYKAVMNPKIWEMVDDKEITPAMLKDVKKGNIIRNPSFELGSMGYSYPMQIYRRRNNKGALDGEYCLSFTKGGLIDGMLESLYYRISPGKLYTFSAYVKGDKPDTHVTLRVLSGYQWSKGYGSLSNHMPVAVKRVVVGTEWKRFHFSFIPEYASKSCCKIMVTGTYFQLDAIQLEEGKLTEFKPGKDLDVGVHRDLASRDGLHKLGEKAAYNLEIDCLEKNPGEISLNYIVTDHWDNEVVNRKETVDLKGKRRTLHKAYFSPKEPGIYKLRVEYENPKTGEKVVSEERSFGMAPILPEKPAEPSYFATHIYHRGQVPTAKKAGLSWTRMWDSYICKFKWARVEKEKGKLLYNEKGYDKGLAKCADAGFNILGTISHPVPKWMDKLEGKAIFKDIPAFKRFVYDTVSKFKDKVKYWEVINEPYYTFSSKEYAEILKIAYKEIKRADPDAKVVGICGYLLPGYYTDWIEGILKEVGTDYMDIISTHAYVRELPEFAQPNYTARLDSLRKLLKKYGKADMEIWDTESVSESKNFFSDRLPGADTHLVRGGRGKDHPDHKIAANWLVRHRIVGVANGVTKSFYYAMQHTGTFGHRLINSWLIEYTGTPHPVLMANSALIKEIDGSKYQEQFSLGEKYRCYAFIKEKTPLCVFWRVSGEKDLAEDMVILKGDVSNLVFTNIMGGEYRKIVKRDKNSIEFQLSGEPVYIKAPGMTPENFKKLMESAKIISSEKLKAAAFGVRFDDNSGEMYVQVKNISSDPQDAMITIDSKPESWKMLEKTSLKGIKAETVGSVGIPIKKMTGKGEIKATVRDSLGKSPCQVMAFPRKCLVALATKGKIEMDGSFKEWPESKVAKISEHTQIKAGIDKWTGEKDLSGAISACYDDKNLYLAVRVKDDSILVEGMGVSGRSIHKLYKSDCVELFFEPGIMTTIKPEIYQFFTVTTSKKQNLPAVCALYMRHKAEGIEIASVENADGYDLEVKIPFATFKGVKLTKGSMIGFDCSVNDRDLAKGKKDSVGVWSGTKKNYCDSSNYGILLLK